MSPPSDAILAFARASASGALERGPWVDLDPDPTLPPHRVRPGPDGGARFGHLPYAAFLPPPMATALVEAHARGEAGLFEAVLVMMARPEWLVASRSMWLGPLSPQPMLLAELVEACGIDRAVHRDEPALLARLAALLPDWRLRRGQLAAALRVLEDGAGASAPGPVQQGPGGPAEPALAARHEAIACRAASWWTARLRASQAPALWIRGGFLRCTGPDVATGPDAATDPLDRLPQDLCLAHAPGASPPARLLRLLPLWTSLRLFTPAASTPSETP